MLIGLVILVIEPLPLGIVFLGSHLVTWKVRSSVVAHSSIEAEYCAMATCML